MKDTNLHNYIEDYYLKLKKQYTSKISDKKNRIAKFDAEIEKIKIEDIDTQPYLRVALAFYFIDKADEIYLSTSKLDYKEVAMYFTTVINDIESIADKDVWQLANLNYLYISATKFTISRFAHTLVNHCTETVVRKFMNSIINTRAMEDKFYEITRYFSCISQEYIKSENYPLVADYGRWYIEILEHKKISPYDLCNFEYHIDSIYSSLDKALKELGVKDEKIEEIMIGVRERETEPRSNKLGRLRSALYDMAESCKANGDMTGYYGYMSALGDVGR